MIDASGAVVSSRTGPVVGTGYTYLVSEVRDTGFDQVFGEPGQHVARAEEYFDNRSFPFNVAGNYETYRHLVEHDLIDPNQTIDSTLDAHGEVRELDQVITARAAQRLGVDSADAAPSMNEWSEARTDVRNDLFDELAALDGTGLRSGFGEMSINALRRDLEQN